MNRAKWMTLAAALAMMGATAAVLQRGSGALNLGPPGVKVGASPVYSETNRLVSSQGVLLPGAPQGWTSKVKPMLETEVAALPDDTTFGRCTYNQGNFEDWTTVVLMGKDRNSLHRPQWCLPGIGWEILQTISTDVPMTRPYRYRMPVGELRLMREDGGRKMAGVYVYWYVDDNKISPGQWTRLWSQAWTAVTTGVRERWAYISYFAACYPGQEQATFERLEKLIEETTPEFQIPSGPREQ